MTASSTIAIVVLGLLLCWCVGTIITLIKELKARQRAARDDKNERKE